MKEDSDDNLHKKDSVFQLLTLKQPEARPLLLLPGLPAHGQGRRGVLLHRHDSGTHALDPPLRLPQDCSGRPGWGRVRQPPDTHQTAAATSKILTTDVKEEDKVCIEVSQGRTKRYTKSLVSLHSLMNLSELFFY